MGITFTNNWKNIADKLRSTFRTEFKGALPVYINDENISTGGQYLQLDLASTSLSEKMVGCELREYTVSLSYIFQSPNVKKSSLDHVLRYTSRIEQLMQNNISLSLTDSTAAVNCRIESTELQEGEDNSYLVSFDWKCQHLSGLSEVVATTPALLNNFSLEFDGTNDYVNMGNVCNLGTSDFTISGWINATDYTNNQSFVSKYEDGNNRWYFGTDSSDRPIFYSKKDGSAVLNLTGTDVVTENVWHHFAISCDRDGTENLYIDGVLNASAICSDGDIDNAGDLHIGRYSTTYHQGNIDEVAIWDKALSATEIAAIYNQKIGSSTIMDLSYDTVDYKSSDNLIAYYRMGDGVLDDFNLIADQVNPKLGSDVYDDNYYGGSYPTGVTEVGDELVFDNYTGTLYGSGTGGSGTRTVGRIYKYEYEITEHTSGYGISIHPEAVGVYENTVGEHIEYFVAAQTYVRFYLSGWTGKIKKTIVVREVQGNAGLMTNMESADISTEVPKQVINLQAVPNTFSLDFDGSNDYVALGNLGLSDSLGAITKSIWYKTTTTGTEVIWDIEFGAKDNGFYISGGESPPAIKCELSWSSGSTEIVLRANADVNDGNWHHLAMTYDGTSFTTYFDGVQQNTSDSDAGETIRHGFSSVLGQRFLSGGYNFEGNIDEVAVWNTALDGDAVKAIYNGGNPTDLKVDNGAYDEYTDNLQGYWRMGDGTDLPYPFITDEKGTVGSELVVDGSSNWVGDFDVSGDISSWASTDSGELAISHDSSNNAMQLTGGSASSGKWAYYTATVEVGESYAVSVKMISRNDSGTVPNLRVGRTIGGTEYFNTYWTSFITQGTIFTASTNTTCIIAIGVNGNNNDAGFDNISLKKVSGNTGLMTNMVVGDIEEDTP